MYMYEIHICIMYETLHTSKHQMYLRRKLHRIIEIYRAVEKGEMSLLSLYTSFLSPSEV